MPKRQFDIRSSMAGSRRVERPKNWVRPNAIAVVEPDALGTDVRIRFIRKFFSSGEEDKTSFFKRLQAGWLPVKFEELERTHPHLAYLRDPDGFIAWNGCILCKIDAQTAAYNVQECEDMALGRLEKESVAYNNESQRAGFKTKVAASSRKSFQGREPSAG